MIYEIQEDDFHLYFFPLLFACCCLPCNHCSNWTWKVEEMFANGNRVNSMQCRDLRYFKLRRPANFVGTTQLLVD